MNDKTKRIAELNDQCRQSVTMPVFGKRPCKVFMTQGIAALSPEDQIIIAAKVRDFKDFCEDNNPYGERDFGHLPYPGFAAGPQRFPRLYVTSPSFSLYLCHVLYLAIQEDHD